MKKITAVILIVVLLLCALPVVSLSASTLPFTEEDYLREDFSFKDYKDYVVDSIDKNGCEWPEDAKAIEWEIESGRKNINTRKDVKLPDGIEIIGDCCFMNRWDITEGEIDFSRLTELRYIGDNAFRDTKINRVDLSKTKVVRIGEMAFYTTSLTHFIASPTLKRIDTNAFGRHCAIAYIELNEGLEYIGDYAFVMNKTRVKLPSTLKHIGAYAFSNTSYFDVYKGSYAEEWCKANNKHFTYLKTEEELRAEKEADAKYDIYPDITHRVGPLKITKYLSHVINEKTNNDGERKVFFRVLCTEGVSAETIYDNTEIYYTPYYSWDIGEQGMPYAATVETEKFLNYRNGPAYLSDYNIKVTKSKKLDYGWSKGFKWEFFDNDIGFGDAKIIAVYNGVQYFYEFDMGWKKYYQRALETPDYDYKAFISNDSAKATDTVIIADGKRIECKAYNLYYNNYFMLRDAAMFLKGSGKQFDVGWNSSEEAVEITTNKEYQPIGNELQKADTTAYRFSSYCPQPMYKDGKEILLRTYAINGNNYIQLRDLGRLLDFSVTWDENQNAIVIDTSKKYTEEQKN